MIVVLAGDFEPVGRYKLEAFGSTRDELSKDKARGTFRARMW